LEILIYIDIITLSPQRRRLAKMDEIFHSAILARGGRANCTRRAALTPSTFSPTVIPL
jgi:hypothetical protein